MRAFCAVLLALICVTVPATAQRQTCEPGCAHGLLIEHRPVLLLEAASQVPVERTN
jgi:hypothetical protein